ncbi:PREDICTED: uncharacterized protein LOC107331783 isoform X2 [Acropora digitifera]|uniref:uncharacterized protein LOC107331783 isoform X2 n=1 Tax=Acropora digitifera TaxID=70779 RepID=UPI00077B117C|nr:PREDICTED: uncharacterized protein LOC107331783 isoform X2 [Acropora digitifera]
MNFSKAKVRRKLEYNRIYKCPYNSIHLGPLHHWLCQAGVSSLAYQSQTFIALERHRWVGSNCAVVCCTHLKNVNEFDRRIFSAALPPRPIYPPVLSNVTERTPPRQTDNKAQQHTPHRQANIGKTRDDSIEGKGTAKPVLNVAASPFIPLQVATSNVKFCKTLVEHWIKVREIACAKPRLDQHLQF